MSYYTKRGFLALMVMVLGIFVVSQISYAQPANVQAAKKEGKVVVYGAVPSKTMDIAINKPFEKKYGIKVEYWRGSSTKVMDRALTEFRAGRPGFDVADGNRGVQLIMKEHGLFTKFIPVPSEKFPNQFKEKGALITPWRVLPLGILYNTELLKKSDLPGSLQDLLQPKWKDKICMPDASRHTTTAQFLANLDKLMGDKWLDYVKALAKQNPHLVQSLAPVTNVIIRGETPLGITYIKYVRQYKGPTDYVMLDKFLADTNYVSLGAKAPHPNAGRLYIEYTTSAAGQKAMADQGEFVLYPGISPAIRDADKVAARTVMMDAPSEAEFKKLRAQFHKIFLGK